MAWLAFPAARVAGWFLGTGCVAAAEGLVLPHPDLAVAVTSACSGSAFAVLVAAVLLGQAAGWPATRWHRAGLMLAAPLVALVVTVLVNAARIVCCWRTGLLARAFLPERAWGLVHLATGVAVFLLALIAIYGSTVVWSRADADED